MGQLAFFSTDGNGDLINLKDHNGWPNRWTHVIPGNFGGSGYSDLLFYDAQTGDASFYLSDGSGGIQSIKEIIGGWKTFWTHIIPGNFGGGKLTDLLFYDGARGSAVFYVNSGNAQMKPVQAIGPGGWNTGISHIIPGNFGGGELTDLLFYNPLKGSAAFYVNDGNAQMRAIRLVDPGKWRTSWTHIIPGNFGGGKLTDLLFYEGSTGSAEFYVNNGNAQMKVIQAIKPGGWNKDIKHIIPGNFGKGELTDLLFYNPNKGSAAFYANDGNASMKLLKAVGDNGWKKTWSKIIPGNFGGNAYTDLMFYEQLGTEGNKGDNGKSNFSVELKRRYSAPASSTSPAKEESPRPNHVCSVQQRKISLSTDEHILLEPASGFIWPGSLVIASSVITGEYKQAHVSQSRSSIKISTSDIGHKKISYKLIERPEQAYVQNAIREFHQEGSHGIAAKLKTRMHSVYSKEHFNVTLKGHYKAGLDKLTGRFSFDTDTVTNKLLVDFKQVYYTIDVSTPYYEFFKDKVSGDDIAYVSSVTYGRRLLFLLESTESVQDLQAAVGYASGDAIDINLTAKYKNIFKESKISALILGGDVKQGSDVIDINNGIDEYKKTIQQYIKGGAQGGLNSPPVPLSYKLQYLSDGAIAYVGLTTSYKSRICQKSNGQFSVKLKEIVLIEWDDWGEIFEIAQTEEIYGSFSVHAYASPGEWLGSRKLWDVKRDDFKQIYSRTEFKNQSRKPSSLNVDKEVRFSFDDFHKIKDTGYFIFTGTIRERDWGITGDDDLYSGSSKRVDFKNAITPDQQSGEHADEFKIEFQGGETGVGRLEVRFEVNPVE